MIFLNGKFVEKNEAYISVMDRGFLFGDGVYEVIPVYANKIFQLEKHLIRLKKSLESIKLTNPYSFKKWLKILSKVSNLSTYENQLLYLQITRGADVQRKHSFDKLTPTVFVQSSPLTTKTKQELSVGFNAITEKDIRWGRCDIKSTSLLANILYSQKAQENKVEEVILYRNEKVTEGAASNVFIVKNNTLFTHPEGTSMLTGITRDLILKSAINCNIEVNQTAFSLSDMLAADEVWISSSTREVMPIINIDNNPIKKGKTGKFWGSIYDSLQHLKNE